MTFLDIPAGADVQMPSAVSVWSRFMIFVWACGAKWTTRGKDRVGDASASEPTSAVVSPSEARERSRCHTVYCG